MQIYMQQSCELVCLQVIYVAETANPATFISASPSSFVINNAMSTSNNNNNNNNHDDRNRIQCGNRNHYNKT